MKVWAHVTNGMPVVIKDRYTNSVYWRIGYQPFDPFISNTTDIMFEVDAVDGSVACLHADGVVRKKKSKPYTVSDIFHAKCGINSHEPIGVWMPIDQLADNI